MTVTTKEELVIYDEISKLGQALWTKSLRIVGSNLDPKMFSIMLFKRLWSNHRGYTLLHNNGFFLESDIVLRSGLEAAICIAANYHLRNEFVTLMKQDVAYTILGQIKVHRKAGVSDLVSDSEATLRIIQAQLPEGIKPARLNWQALAEKCKVNQLYGFYRELSGTSSHVTGMSVLRGVVAADGSESNPWDELNILNKRHHLMMMAGATLTASRIHADMLDDEENSEIARKLVNRMNYISESWIKE